MNFNQAQLDYLKENFVTYRGERYVSNKAERKPFLASAHRKLCYHSFVLIIDVKEKKALFRFSMPWVAGTTVVADTDEEWQTFRERAEKAVCERRGYYSLKPVEVEMLDQFDEFMRLAD